MNKGKYYQLHDIVEIYTDVPIGIPEYFKKYYTLLPEMGMYTKIIIQKEKFIKNTSDVWIRRKDFKYTIKDNGLCIDYGFNVQLILQLFDDEIFRVVFSPNFLKYSRLQVSIRPIIQQILINNGYSFIHAGCLDHKDESILIVAPRDFGKTSTILSLLDGEDFKFMSDDLTIISRDGFALSYPEQVDISPYTSTGSVVKPNTSVLGKSFIISLLYNRIFNKEFTQKRQISSEIITDKAPISKVFILSSGDKSTKQISNNEATSQIFTSTIDLINPTKYFIYNFYSYIFNIDLYKCIENQHKIIEQSITKAECYDISSTNISDYHKQIRKLL